MAAAGFVRSRARRHRSGVPRGALRRTLTGAPVFSARSLGKGESRCPSRLEDAILTRQALAYVIELYRELSEENGAPSLGTQNQVVDFIRTDPELREAVARWAQSH